MNDFGEPTSQRDANRIAGRFLRSAWSDDRVPGVVPAKDGYGAAIWRQVARQDRPGRPPGVLTLDIDVVTGLIVGLRFERD